MGSSTLIFDDLLMIFTSVGQKLLCTELVIAKYSPLVIMRLITSFRVQELCEVEVAVLGSPSLIVRTISVDVKQQ